MSIAVDLAELPDEIGRRGFGYLLTTGDDLRPRAVALIPQVVDGLIRFDAGGGRTCASATARPAVSVVFPPTPDDRFSLVVDGDAAVNGVWIDVRPTWAVRHRPAP